MPQTFTVIYFAKTIQNTGHVLEKLEKKIQQTKKKMVGGKVEKLVDRRLHW